MRKDKRMLNKTILKKNSWFCAGSQVTDMPEGLCVATSPSNGIRKAKINLNVQEDPGIP